MPPISWARLWRDSFDMMKRAKEIIGIFFIVGIAGTIVIFAQRAKALEERDRMTLEEVKEIRIALQQYFDAHQRFPEELPPDIAGGARYGYQCTQQAQGACTTGFCTDKAICTNYEFTFDLAYGSERYGKGMHRADKDSMSSAP